MAEDRKSKTEGDLMKAPGFAVGRTDFWREIAWAKINEAIRDQAGRALLPLRDEPQSRPGGKADESGP